MNKLIPYLVFPGKCKEALNFYKETLNGEITSIMTFGESPLQVPDEMNERIYNSEFKAGNILFKASDDLPSHEVKSGSNISLFVVFPDKKTKEDSFKKMSEGGKIIFQMGENFGMLKDKFGIQWMFVNEE